MQPNSREEYMELARKLCTPILSYYSPDDSRVHLPNRLRSDYSDQTADLESFSRPLWAMAALVKNGDDEAGSTIISMIKNGVDKKSEFYWGKAKNNDQMIVEMPAIAFFVYENFGLVKDTLDESSIKALVKWLSQVNKLTYHENNWQFFGILINAILLNLGLGGSREVINRNWKKLNGHYLGNGWYSDGNTKQRDYYIAFAYHFYSLLWVYSDKEIEPDVKQLITKRAEEFALSYKLFFGANGASVPYGRSLIYRFATVSFWSAYKLVGLTGVSDGDVKAIIGKNIDWWLKQDILNSDGTLNAGYAYGNTLMTENYNATGSPYWAFKAFVLLLIPEDNDFWIASPCGGENEDGVKYIDKADFFISRLDGAVLLYPLNHRASWEWENSTSKYEKFVYSSGHGFCVPCGNETKEGIGCDSSLAVSFDQKHWITRHNTVETKLNNNTYYSIWNIDSDAKIHTWICIFNGWHVRIHTVETERELSIMDCGFSVSVSNLAESEKEQGLFLQDKENGLFSAVVPFMGKGEVNTYNAPPNSNILFPNVRIPYVSAKVKPGKYTFIDGFYGGSKAPSELPMIKAVSNSIHIRCGEEETVVCPEERPNITCNTSKRSNRVFGSAKKKLSVRHII